MNSKNRHTKIYLVGCLAGFSVLGLFFIAVVWASSAARPDYQGFDLTAPWFDGKPFDYYLDMVNAPSIKPQEVGTFQRFPDQSVPRTGVEPEVPNTVKDDVLLRDQFPKNPTKATIVSLAKGRKLFNIYCAVCHAKDGMGNTPVTQKGIPAIPIKVMFVGLTEAHIYNKIRYGGAIMPAYGFQTSQSDRWDMVNYMKSQNFGK